MIESKQREESKFKRFKHIQPKAVHLAQRTLVERRYLEADQPLPLVIQPAVEDVDLAAWGQENRGKVEEELLVHGAILFRGSRSRAQRILSRSPRRSVPRCSVNMGTCLERKPDVICMDPPPIPPTGPFSFTTKAHTCTAGR